MMDGKRMNPWRPLSAGQRVQVRADYHKGEMGTVIEPLDREITGMGRYGVRLDHSPSLTTDYCRFELIALKELDRRGKSRPVIEEIRT